MPDIEQTSLCGIFGLVAGTLSGFLGMGGGAILTPLFVFILGMEQHRAQGISLAALLPPVGIPAVLAYRKRGVFVDVALTVLLVLGFVIGSFGGAWFAHRVPTRELTCLFAVFLIASAWRTISKTDAPSDIPPIPTRRWLGVPIGLAAGAASGLLGIGGAIVAIPLLRRFLRLGRLESQATTLAMMLPPIGLPAVYVYAKEQGGLPWHLLAAVVVGFMIGAGVGAIGAGRANSVTAARIYAGFLVALAIVLVIKM